MVEAAWPGRNEDPTARAAENFFPRPCGVRRNMGWWRLPGPGETIQKSRPNSPRSGEFFFSQALWSEEKQGVVLSVVQPIQQ